MYIGWTLITRNKMNQGIIKLLAFKAIFQKTAKTNTFIGCPWLLGRASHLYRMIEWSSKGLLFDFFIMALLSDWVRFIFKMIALI